MEYYLNLSGESNVNQYEIGTDYIIVKFKTRSKDGCDTYKYTYASASPGDIEHMKGLARAGRGLNSYINTNVRKQYESKW